MYDDSVISLTALTLMIADSSADVASSISSASPESLAMSFCSYLQERLGTAAVLDRHVSATLFAYFSTAGSISFSRHVSHGKRLDVDRLAVVVER